MILVELLQQLINVQGSPNDWQSILDGLLGSYGSESVWKSKFSCGDQQGICPASSFTAIGAAFATQGYFVQADLLYYLTNTEFGLWAPLLYIMAAMGGLISLALGAPPKMYLWFFFGPALYSWLLDTREPVHGVQWRIADVPQDQRRVWQLAEVGLQNMNIVKRGMEQGDDLVPRRLEPTHDPVYVSNLFLWFDELISSTVQWMVRWTGIYTLRGGRQEGGGGTGADSTGILPAPENAEEHDRWYLLSNLKWSMLETITGARLHDADLRDAFVTFLSSECGDSLSQMVNKKNFVAASHSKSGRIPCTVFKEGENPSNIDDAGKCIKYDGPAPNGDEYKEVEKTLKNTYLPAPESLSYMWDDKITGSFYCFFGDDSGSGSGTGGNTTCTNQMSEKLFAPYKDINCRTYLYTMVNGFRWEAGHIYHQLVAQAPEGMGDDEMLFNLFYGWDIRNDQDELLEKEDLRLWTQNLILIHLIRNEMANAPEIGNSRHSSADNVTKDVDSYQREVGGKSKYGEVYTWALMTPYLQGVMLYLLAMGYPFACILIVVPGWHRALFTWMSFWAWVKLWDVGFAIVGVLERSIWAMIGNNSSSANLSPMIAVMKNWGNVTVQYCSIESSSSNDDLNFEYNAEKCPPVPSVVTDGGGDPDDENYTFLKGPSWVDAMKIFDRAMLLGANLDFDLANSYYVYIMAALYFAVPAATGQLVLGAKAGAAGMVGNMIGGVASEGGRAAGQGYTGRLKQDGVTNSATLGQDSLAKSWRKGGQGGLAGQAINVGNMQGLRAYEGQEFGAMQQGYGNMRSIADMNAQAAQANLGNRFAGANLYTSALGGIPALGGTLLSTADKALLKPFTDLGDKAAAALGIGGTNAAPPEGLTGADGPAAAAQSADLINQAVRGSAKWGNLYSSFLSPFTAPLGSLQQMGSNQITRGFLPQYAALQGAQAQAGIDSFGAQAQAGLYGAAERRMTQHADYGGQMDAWRARRDFGNQLAGRFAALGADTSFLNPGPKPSDMMGMAMAGNLNNGMLGSGGNLQSMASFFNPGGVADGLVGQRVGMLGQTFGGTAIQGGFNDGGGVAAGQQFMQIVGNAITDPTRFNLAGTNQNGTWGFQAIPGATNDVVRFSPPGGNTPPVIPRIR